MDLVYVDEGSTRIVLFESSTGDWYVRGYFDRDEDGPFDFEVPHQEVSRRFQKECQSLGIAVSERGGARWSRLSKSERRVMGKSVSLGPIQNVDKLQELLVNAYPDLIITFDL